MFNVIILLKFLKNRHLLRDSLDCHFEMTTFKNSEVTLFEMMILRWISVSRNLNF